jgi:hypothetical protein
VGEARKDVDARVGAELLDYGAKLINLQRKG